MYREENISCAGPRARYLNTWGSDHVKRSPTPTFSYPETLEKKVHSQDQPSFEDPLVLPHILLLPTFRFYLLEGV
jgi:hypothetical protein